MLDRNRHSFRIRLQGMRLAPLDSPRFQHSRMKQSNQTSARQTTLAESVRARGIGLHTAVPVQVRLTPAPPDTGYVFRRTDLGGFEIPATVESVAHCSYATTLMRTGVMLSTVEHHAGPHQRRPIAADRKST